MILAEGQADATFLDPWLFGNAVLPEALASSAHYEAASGFEVQVNILGPTEIFTRVAQNEATLSSEGEGGDRRI